MNFEKRVWFIVDAITLLLTLLSLRLVYWQMVRGVDLLPVQAAASGPTPESQGISAQELENLLGKEGSLENLGDLPQPAVQRISDFLETITRGSIYDRSGSLLAQERLDSQGNRSRYYIEPSLAHVLGYVSGLQIGIAGLERTYNPALLGLDQPQASLERMLHEPVRGGDLLLTIDRDLQRQAEQALEGRTGSVTIMDAKSGAILAMASLPRFDPNRVLEEGYLSNLVESCGGSPLCSAPLLNRAAQALYPPGSTWKTVTLIAALDSGQVTPQTVFDFGEPLQGPNGPYYVYKVGGGTITDPNHSEAQLNLEMSYAKSANAAFARIGDEMPADVLIEYASRLGFGAPGEAAQMRARFPLELALELDYSPGQLAGNLKDLYDNDLLRAVTAIGQGELLTSPLNMGMVLLAVMNDGDLPLPYLVQGIHYPSGAGDVRQPPRDVLHGIMQPHTAQLVRQMMETTVAQGSGRKAAVPGLTIGGKTGTAQVGGNLPPHAWFTGFAQQGDRAVVIVVMIENGGEGSQVAAPVFARLAAAALSVDQPAPEFTPQPETSTPEAAELPVATPTQTSLPPEANPPTATPTPAIPGLPPPDIPYKPGKVDFTEMASATCPGNQKGPLGSGQFRWPSVYQAVSGEKFSESHPGIDLSAPAGTPVYAADAGLVIFAGWSELGYGNVVVIDHGNGYKTLYAHLSQVSQYCGAKVKAGQVIGMSGSTGNSSGPHLHFEVRVPGGYLNPLKVLPTP